MLSKFSSSPSQSYTKVEADCEDGDIVRVHTSKQIVIYLLTYNTAQSTPTAKAKHIQAIHFWSGLYLDSCLCSWCTGRIRLPRSTTAWPQLVT